MQLSEITSLLIQYRLASDANLDIPVSYVTTDHRKVQPGSLFIAIRGFTHDGHRFVGAAVEAGAVAVMVEEATAGVDVPQIIVPNTRVASAMVADLFYGHPSQRLKMIGVTGTNGKTTTTHFIEKVLTDAGHEVGLRGTLGKRIKGVHVELENTTPEAVELQETLHEMVRAECDFGVMEVSSHALEWKRDAGIRYRTAVFTNLTQDHLDFHGTMDNYRAAKGKLFSRLGNTYGNTVEDTSFAVLNADDEASAYFRDQTVAQVLTYGIAQNADVRASEVKIGPQGAEFSVDTFRGSAKVSLQMTGRFNVYNALAAITVGLIEGIELSALVASLEAIQGVPGRFESVLAGQDFTVLVDYSHTPDSLEKALLTVREFATARVITVVGCGGDRDKTKRPLMAQTALEHSDVTIFTSDNPRTEDPEAILDDMVSGVSGFDAREAAASVAGTRQHERIADRKVAIERAITLATTGDVVLIAGKGHETYQIIGKHKTHFDDRETAREAIHRLRPKQ